MPPGAGGREITRDLDEVAGLVSNSDSEAESASSIVGISATNTRINGISSSLVTAVEEQAAVLQDMSGNMQTAALGVDSISSALGEINRSVRTAHTETETLQTVAAVFA